VTEFGYALSSEEHGPAQLVENARKAEEHGFEFAFVSDHYHGFFRFWKEELEPAP
jgi:coenzyme F420-dependent glucose-6-phosphate dehydrogenase